MPFVQSVLMQHAYNLDIDDVEIVFLAYNGSSGILKRNRLLLYEGVENYWAHAANMKIQEKVCVHSTYDWCSYHNGKCNNIEHVLCSFLSQMTAKAFNKMFKSSSKHWEVAVREADLLNNISVAKRVQFYNSVLFNHL